ncbi:PHB depolymerase family esterase [Asanoa sp. NPDC049518]|uniref:extracellular catalytic domain type 1 short-chain-length polyhydroxyalkanoate depolymerase n=1 Tax=unclassified Asanoa TaxID=2685164 RepID=UPI00343CB1FA
MRLPKALHALWIVLATAVVAATLLVASPAKAATLTEVTNFGANPGNLRMYVYVPDRVAARPGLLVAVHYCTGSGPALYSGTEFARLADQYGYVVVYPSVTASDGCFDVASTATLTHNGGSDSLSIVSMTRYAQQTYNADPSRTFVTGVSSGAMMTNVLLGAYPDVFRAGAAFAGVPFGCFAGSSKWNSQCAQGQLTRTPQQWGDLVRNAYPGYTGSRPRVQLWHGTNDEILSYVNFGEAVKQWTNVHGLSQTPTSTDSPQSGWTRTRYANSAGQVQVEAISMANTSHNLPVQASAAIAFFGLNSGGPTNPPTTTPPPGNGGCTAVLSVTSAWQSGYVASVRVTAGSAGVNGWRVGLPLPSGNTIVNSWSGQFSGSGSATQVSNVAYNGRLAAGAATEFGFQANGPAPNPVPSLSCTAL